MAWTRTTFIIGRKSNSRQRKRQRKNWTTIVNLSLCSRRSAIMESLAFSAKAMAATTIATATTATATCIQSAQPSKSRRTSRTWRKSLAMHLMVSPIKPLLQPAQTLRLPQLLAVECKKERAEKKSQPLNLSSRWLMCRYHSSTLQNRHSPTPTSSTLSSSGSVSCLSYSLPPSSFSAAER